MTMTMMTMTMTMMMSMTTMIMVTRFPAGRRRGSTRRTIEELRTSRSELKLPQEMDFKFK